MSKEENSQNQWKYLFIVGGITALLVAIVFRKNWGAEGELLRMFGIISYSPTHPSTALEWFTLFQNNWWAGLVLLNLVDVVNYILVGITYLALYGALKDDNKSLMIIANFFSFIAIVAIIASNQSFSMLNLSIKYASATTEEERTMLLIAGEVLLAIGNPTSPYLGVASYISHFFLSIGGLIIAFVMLKTEVFGRKTSILGLIANIILVVFYFPLFGLPELFSLLFFVSSPALLAWYIIIGLKLFQLSKKS